MYTTHPQPQRQPLALRRGVGDFVAMLFFLTALAVGAGMLGWSFWHMDRIYTGVSVAGVPVGGLSRAGAISKLSRELTPYPLQPVTLSDGQHSWTVTPAQIDVEVDLLGAVNQAFLLGRRDGLGQDLATQWGLFWQGENLTPPLSFDVGQVRYWVSQIAAEARRTPRPATQIGPTTVPGQAGLEVSVEATAAAVLEALYRGKATTLPLQTVVLPIPAGSPATGSDANPLPNAVTLSDPQTGLMFALDPATLDSLIQSRDPLRLNEERLRGVVADWAAQINTPARDARLSFNPATGALAVLKPSQIGRSLDVDATLTAVGQALESGETEAILPVALLAPAVDAARTDQLGIVELVAEGSTSFAGSSADRVRNIVVAAEKFDGVVIPPGEVFSFNSIVEDVSAANGFEDSLIIWGDRTAVGVGGGVCQASTTIFRAALNAGFPIVERYNHGYVVSWYGAPGMDATIYTPTVDFRFRNDTGHHILIDPIVNTAAGVITYRIYGTKPDRQVTIAPGVITDVEEPGPPVYQRDESLAPGQTKQVEFAQKGMAVTVQRTITENGVTRTDEMVSTYQPWQAMYLVGPGVEIPGE
ncbi:MAG: VanW family protein [Caldilineaceae bacterium]|nr:VanW family protein [Caldilineaceae bacterium]